MLFRLRCRFSRRFFCVYTAKVSSSISKSSSCQLPQPSTRAGATIRLPFASVAALADPTPSGAHSARLTAGRRRFAPELPFKYRQRRSADNTRRGFWLPIAVEAQKRPAETASMRALVDGSPCGGGGDRGRSKIFVWNEFREFRAEPERARRRWSAGARCRRCPGRRL
jgi:hypothetical protein